MLSRSTLLVLAILLVGVIGSVPVGVPVGESRRLQKIDLGKLGKTVSIPYGNVPAKPTIEAKIEALPTSIPLAMSLKPYKTAERVRFEYWPVRPGVDCATAKCIALTFDDGPSAHTAQLLDILHAKKTLATFFVVGQEVAKYGSVMQRMVDEGHEVGNHSFGHKNFRKITHSQIAAEINAAQEVIYSATGYRPHIVRPPGGNVPMGDPELSKYPIVMWNNDPDDWKERDTAVIQERVMSNIAPGRIILLHDLYGSSVIAVPHIIDKLNEQGYTLVTVSELFGWNDNKTMLPAGQVLYGR